MRLACGRFLPPSHLVIGRNWRSRLVFSSLFSPFFSSSFSVLEPKDSKPKEKCKEAPFSLQTCLSRPQRAAWRAPQSCADFAPPQRHLSAAAQVFFHCAFSAPKAQQEPVCGPQAHLRLPLGRLLGLLVEQKAFGPIDFRIKYSDGVRAGLLFARLAISRALARAPRQPLASVCRVRVSPLVVMVFALALELNYCSSSFDWRAQWSQRCTFRPELLVEEETETESVAGGAHTCSLATRA